jgi:hypothetical protein
MTASDKLNARLASLTTEQLVEISLRLTLDTSDEAIIVCNRAERELAKRMTDAEFGAHMDACEALLDLAA